MALFPTLTRKLVGREIEPEKEETTLGSKVPYERAVGEKWGWLLDLMRKNKENFPPIEMHYEGSNTSKERA